MNEIAIAQRARSQAAAMSWQEGIHQAVDIGFSIADLLGGLFGDAMHRHTIVRRLDDENTGVFLALDNSQTTPTPQLVLNQDASSSLYSVVTPATTQAPVDGSTVAGPLYAAPMLLTPDNPSADFTQLPNFTKGLFTASLVDTSNPQEVVPLAGITARGALMGAQGVPLLPVNTSTGNPTLSFNIDPSDPSSGAPASVTLVNDHSVPLAATFTFMTSAPNQSFTIPFAVVQPGEQSTLPMPVPLSQATTFEQMNAVAYGSSSALTAL